MSRILYSSAMARIVPLTEARAALSELLDDVETKQDHVVITRNGKPVALLMSMSEWESWEETIEVLSDPELLEDLDRSDEDVAAGRLVDWDEIKHKYGLA